MNRPSRIALNILLPPLLAAACFSLFIIAASIGEVYNGPNRNLGDALGQALGISLYIVMFAYVLAILPSLLHAVLMELAYYRIPSNTWAAVGVSTLSGTFAGLLITAFITNGRLSPIAILYLALGAFVGFLVGGIVKRLSRRAAVNTHATLRGCE